MSQRHKNYVPNHEAPTNPDVRRQRRLMLVFGILVAIITVGAIVGSLLSGGAQ